MSSFYTSLRSTVGKLSLDIAVGMGLPSYEIDDVTAVSEALASDEPAVLWQVVSIAENPRDPLWVMNFLIGAKTNSDVGNTTLTDIVDGVLGQLSVSESVLVADYSTPGAVTEGSMTVTNSVVDPQEYERQAGVRMVSISVVANRLAA